ncbi:hypothetical protein L227DRAFT_194982 [Lentinus tigrinus ALCF2SS1-6]|uniref:Uncharacterized protein n=1 Tax=Lentinus tigrinus ALCF2SS1-6 TaxID=1328759 RepID=A0A5C2S358_9APHY|nr:hypothetical protein L227DRAFT_194982 [Lentinus tigrinus ALCF2SS1-6]
MYSHGALHNTDILNELFEHLSLTPRHVTEADIHGLYRDDAAVKRQALAHAALTCKAFSKPASRVLWMVLHRGIQPFLRVFSNFHENAEEQWAVLQRLYKIEGETTSIEWAQFERLAARVRCVVFDVRPPIAESTLGLLKAGWEASKKPLFPNLSVVDWPDSLNDTHRGLLQVVCANRNLSSILIKHGFKYATTISPADLSVVARSSPKLLHLHIRSNWHTSWHVQGALQVSASRGCGDPGLYRHDRVHGCRHCLGASRVAMLHLPLALRLQPFTYGSDPPAFWVPPVALPTRRTRVYALGFGDLGRRDRGDFGCGARAPMCWITLLIPRRRSRRFRLARYGYRQDLKLPDVERLAQMLRRLFPHVGDLGESLYVVAGRP